MIKVEVLMSTYNGVRYVGRQIESILEQKGVDVHITIRDDGSTDDTWRVLDLFESKYPNYIKVVYGDNVGYKKSFLTLLSLAEPADYYAFSDQDDIWEPCKLYAAVKLIKDVNIALYVSNLTICNPQLDIIGRTTFTPKYSSIYSEFVRHRYAGCTYVFDVKLKQIVSAFSDLTLPSEKMPSHDALISRCAYACGTVVLDVNSYIKHIRYEHSITTHSNSIIERIKIEWKGLVRSSMTYATVRIILDCIPEYITNESLCFFRQIMSYRQSFSAWMSLLFNPKMTCGIFLCDILCRLKILIRTY